MIDDIANYGDAARRVMARGRFVVKELGTDLRVLEHYKHWFSARDVPRLWKLGKATNDAVPLFEAIWRDPSDAELAAVARLLREDMGIRFLREDHPWAVRALIMVFQVAAFNDVARREGLDQMSVEVKLEGLSGPDPGRFPRHEGKDIHRDVAWCYRALIKHPPDSIAQLTQEYVNAENRVTEAHSVVVAWPLTHR
jgi:hypothetical protein